MKGLKLFGVVMFLALVFQTSAQAENLKPATGAFSAHSSNCKPRKKRAVSTRVSCPAPRPQPQMVIATCTGNLVWVPAQQRCFPPVASPVRTPINRCENPPLYWVTFRSSGSYAPVLEYPYLGDDGTRIYYCVGSEERSLYRYTVSDIHLIPGPSRPPIIAGPGQVINGAPTTNGGSCPMATNTVRAMPTVTPSPDYLSPRRKEKVVLIVTFLATGGIGRIDVEQSPGREYTESALTAARQIRFNPAWDNGPVCVRQHMTYEFGSQSSSQDVSPSRKQIVQLSPDNGQMFREKQRKVRFAWESVPDAEYYFLETHYSSAISGGWVLHRKIPVYGTSHEVEMSGPYPVRWRVMAMRPDGTLLVDSDWRRFGYEK